MTNRLADATSPYLLQHADNPVDWWEWSPAAFAVARDRDVPVLLSIGYAACHWCHVMAHESFEDADVAAYLNEHFVSVKVDREERPDIDAIYMAATTALTGSGGWPMTCLLTPTGEPFFAGTYFRREQFLALLHNVARVWREDRERVLSSAEHISRELRAAATPPAPGTFTDADLTGAVARLRTAYDHARGGFGGAPKFPPSMVLELLVREHARTGSADALAMARGTAEAMARSGMYDQLAGGFARYAVDAGWVVPHFEKMLYDNALLARVYLHLWRATGEAWALRIACETADFMLRDLGTAEGGLAASLDADTVVDGVSREGATYVWTPAELVEVLGESDGAAAADLLSVTSHGTFEHGSSTLQLLRDPDDEHWWAGVRGRLLAARAQRPQPARDDKVVTSWCGLAIAALSEIGTLADRPDLVEAAQGAADLLLTRHLVGGRLRRSSRAGVVGSADAVLDDYGNLAEGLLALHQADASPRWLAAAGSLLDVAAELFHSDGAWFDTPVDGERLYTRPAEGADNAEPSGSSSVAGALLTYAALTGSLHHRDLAESALGAHHSLALQAPRFGGWRLAVASAALTGPLEVAVVGSGEAAARLLAVARAAASPGLVIAHGAPDQEGVPLLADRPLVDGEAAAYVCRGMVCDQPVTSPEALAAALA